MRRGAVGPAARPRPERTVEVDEDGRGAVGRVQDLLTRFRPAGAPGPAGATGVPADRHESVAAELAPVFAALAEVEGECDRLRAEATRQAARRTATAAEAARTLVTRAREAAPAERDAAAVAAREAGVDELAQLAADADADAEAIRRRAEQLLPLRLSTVLERVRADLAAALPEVGSPERTGDPGAVDGADAPGPARPDGAAGGGPG